MNLIYTNPGERVLDPEYGINFNIYPFNSNPNTIISGITQAVNKALKKYLPEVTLQNVVINTFDLDNHLLDLSFTVLITPINTITNINYSVM
ncbi:MAG: GPW/gp25 family protein [Candidatus Micrarchaeaceae archaeon]